MSRTLLSLTLALLTSGPAALVPSPCIASPAVAQVTVNGRALSAHETAALAAAVGGAVPPGHWWYDPRSGLFGPVGGGTVGQTRAGLPLGSPPAGCSGTGTGVFVNGREIAPMEVVQLQAMLGPIPPGRYFLEADGRAGREGGPATVNLRAPTPGAGGAAGTFHSSSATGSVSGLYDPQGGSLITVRDASGKAIDWSN